MGKATLTARVLAPSRKITVKGVADGRPVVLQELVNASGPVRLEVTDPRVLHLDPSGGLTLDLAVSERLGPDGREMPPQLTDAEVKWEIEDLRLEVVGRATGGR